MTDFELPQFQVGRYVDLLRRRKWQLVPAAILGLLVGCLVAWMIPRYYVARTTVRIFPRSGSIRASADDPMLEEVRKARITVKAQRMIERSVRELEWTGPYESTDDPNYRRFITDIASRVDVYELEKGQPKRSSAIVALEFRDRTAKRAADFANKLRDVWIDSEYQAILDRGRRLLTKLNTDHVKKRKAFDAAIDERRELIRQYGLDPTPVGPNGRRPSNIHYEKRAELQTKLEAIVARIASARSQLIEFRRRRDALDQKRSKDLRLDPAIQRAIGPLNKKYERLKEKLAKLRPGNQMYKFTQQQLAQIEKGLKTALAEIESAGSDLEVNPAWKKLDDEVERLGTDLRGLDAERESLGRSLAKENSWLETYTDAQSRLARVEQRMASTKREFEAIEQERARQEQSLAQLRIDKDQFLQTLDEAARPPDPTYPNKTLIIVLGAAIGIAVAVGLIFLLDLLQPTFKSYEEVMLGLPVPSLGGVSFLELEEHARAARMRNIRIGIVVALVASLIAAVATIYVIDPVRLPVWVRSVLDGFFAPPE